MLAEYLAFFFFKDTATTEIYTYGHPLSLHDALPISTIHLLPPIIRQLLDHPDLHRRDRSSLRIGYVLSIDPDVLDSVADDLGVPGVMTGYGQIGRAHV